MVTPTTDRGMPANPEPFQTQLPWLPLLSLPVLSFHGTSGLVKTWLVPHGRCCPVAKPNRAFSKNPALGRAVKPSIH